MKAPRADIADAIYKLSAKTPPKRLSADVAAYLLDEGRVSELDSLLRDVMEVRVKAGIVEVLAVSAHPLSAQLLRDIEREVKRLYPQAKSVIISQQRDPELIGGIRLEFPNRQLDLSVRAKLNRLKKLITYGKDQVSA